MSLDNFQLTPFLMEELYKDSLIDLENTQLKPKSLKSEEPVFLGKNARHILILVNEDEAIYLPEDDLAFLISILTPCKLTIADIALVNLSKNPGLQYEALMKQFNPSKMICFGVNLDKLDIPLQFPYYQLQQYNNQVYLAAPTLKDLASDKQQKLQLWNCLKTMFQV